MVEIEHGRKKAGEQYYATKREAAQLRRLHNYALYKAMANTQGIQTKQVKNIMNHIEK
jgi:hypothetical protein